MNSSHQPKVPLYKLRAMFEARELNNKEIAELTGLSRQRVAYYRKDMGFKHLPKANTQGKYDEAEFVRALDRQLSPLAIAHIFGVERDTVARWARNIGRPFPRRVGGSRTFEVSSVGRMTARRVSTPTQARRLGVTTETILRVKRELGINRPPTQPYPQEYHIRAEQLLDDGASYNEVARTLGTSSRWPARHFPGRGWSQEDTGRYSSAVKQAQKAGFDA